MNIEEQIVNVYNDYNGKIEFLIQIGNFKEEDIINLEKERDVKIQNIKDSYGS